MMTTTTRSASILITATLITAAAAAGTAPTSALPRADRLGPMHWRLSPPSAPTNPAGHLPFPTAFSPLPGWPITYPGSSADGGMLVNMDDDPDLELVQVVGNTTYALNPDGYPVPGWPKTTGDGSFSAPAFGDIDGDGEGEVVMHSFYYGIGGKLWAFNRDGSVVTGFPLSLGGTVKAPTLGDVDGDGDLEILSMQNISALGNLYVIDGDGSTLPGWPQTLDHVGGSGPSIGDVDGDGNIEIFAVSYNSLYGFRPEGAPLPGFPYDPGGGNNFNYSSPVLADLDKDGDREIITCTCADPQGTGLVHVVEHDGTAATNWPKPTDYWIYTPPSVADIDGDGWLDVAVGDQILSPSLVNGVYAWNRFGKPLSGFPVKPLQAIFSQIIIADIDSDNAMELLFDGNSSGSDLYACNHDGTPVDGWPLPLSGSSFLQTPSVADIDGDGLMDLAASGNNIGGSQISLCLWTSPLTYTPALAPLPTYQYNVRRDGIVPAMQPNCPADITGDGLVDVLDLLQVLAQWGTAGSADITGDGTVDVLDLLQVLAAWGPC